MKKLFTILMVLAFLCAPVFAFTPSDRAHSSGEQTATATILTGDGYFHQIIVQPDGTNDVTISIYDSTAATGTEITPTFVFDGDGGAQATPPVWIYVNTGIYVVVSVAGAGTVDYVVLYRKR
jgi:hypothetical protein